jgi:zinc and cadmium transporter
MDSISTQIILFCASFLVGIVFIYLNIKNQKIYKTILTFSGAFLFGLTVLHFIPELFRQKYNPLFGAFILLGFSFQIILEFLTQGLDHGHYHHDKKHQLGFSALAGLFIHELFEASPLAEHEGHSHGDYNNFLLWGLVLHKIPVAIFLGTMLSQYYDKKWKAFVVLFLFSIMAPLGLLMAEKISFLHQYHEYFMALVIGIFLYISTTILYETNQNHNFNTRKFISIIIGFAIAVATSL